MAKIKHWTMTGSAPHDYELVLADELHEGGRVAVLRSKVRSPRDFGAICQVISAEDYRSRRIRFSARMRAANVGGWAGLWMRVDGRHVQEPLAFDNMEERGLRGTTDWQPHVIVLDVAPEAEAIYLGALLSGSGELCLSGLAFEEVGPDVPVTGQKTDHPRHPRNLDFGALDDAEGTAT